MAPRARHLPARHLGISGPLPAARRRPGPSPPRLASLCCRGSARQARHSAAATQESRVHKGPGHLLTTHTPTDEAFECRGPKGRDGPRVVWHRSAGLEMVFLRGIRRASLLTTDPHRLSHVCWKSQADVTVSVRREHPTPPVCQQTWCPRAQRPGHRAVPSGTGGPPSRRVRDGGPSLQPVLLLNFLFLK